MRLSESVFVANKKQWAEEAKEWTSLAEIAIATMLAAVRAALILWITFSTVLTKIRAAFVRRPP